MPLHIDRVQAEMQILRKPEEPSAPSAGSETRETRQAFAESLRPIVMEILQDHLRDLERRGVV